MLRKTIIRAFDGSLDDAEGLLAVEKATFNEAPYSPEQVQAMLTEGPQRAWLALGEDDVVGFVLGFPTFGLRPPCWEIDLLAVHPDWTGLGLASRLIRAASAHGMTVARAARAAVATDNHASARAFTRVGFRRAGVCELLLFRPRDHTPRPWVALGVGVQEAASLKEAAGWLPEEAAAERTGEALTLLLAEHQGQPDGDAELIKVQTLLYRGAWIESLTASKRLVQAALSHAAANWATNAGLDEIGMMVPERDRDLREALRSAGFRSLGAFDWLRVPLPLPGLASPHAVGEDTAGEGMAVHV
jgi:ribosomal protein S18 acetylase RimI-like enzyme